MGNGLPGMTMDRRVQKGLTRMGEKMEKRLNGMIMDRNKKRVLTRMGNRLERPNITNLTVFELGVITRG